MLDTNIGSEARRPSGSPPVKEWIAAMLASELDLSVFVIGKVRRGIERLRRRDPMQAAIYEAWLLQLR